MNQYWVRFQAEWWKAGKLYFGTIACVGAALVLLVSLSHLVRTIDEILAVLLFTAAGVYLVPLMSRNLQSRLQLSEADARFSRATADALFRYPTMAPDVYLESVRSYRQAIQTLSATFPASLFRGELIKAHVLGFGGPESPMLYSLLGLMGFSVVEWGSSHSAEHQFEILNKITAAERPSLVITTIVQGIPFDASPKAALFNPDSSVDDIAFQLASFSNLSRREIKDVSVAIHAVINLAFVAAKSGAKTEIGISASTA